MVASRRTIKVKECVHDIRSRMTDDEIREKYRISLNRLKKVFRVLVDSKAISHSELYKLSPLYRKTCDDIQSRRKPRIDLTVRLPIYELGSSSEGVVRDISEHGFRVAGIHSKAGEIKAFQLPVEMFIGFDPLLLIAKCIWVETKGKTVAYPVAGFEIKDISEHDLEALRKLVHLLILSKSGEWKINR